MPGLPLKMAGLWTAILKQELQNAKQERQIFGHGLECKNGYTSLFKYICQNLDLPNLTTTRLVTKADVKQEEYTQQDERILQQSCDAVTQADVDETG